MDRLKQEIGERVRLFRESVRKSQKEFSEMLSIKQQSLSKYETGALNIPDDVKIILLKYGVNPSWLLTGQGPMVIKEEGPQSVSDDGFRSALPDVYKLYRENQRLKEERFAEGCPLCPSMEELDTGRQDQARRYVNFLLQEQRAENPPEEVRECIPEYKAKRKIQIPYATGVAAGEPKEVFFDREFYWVEEDKIHGPEKDYAAVKVTGTSMTGADIFDGDIAIIRKDRDLVPGRILLVRYEDEYTLKRYMKDPDGTERLAYDDGSGRDVIVKPGEWEVIGKFCFAMRPE